MSTDFQNPRASARGAVKKYKIKGRWPEAKIEEVEVLRETEKCIFVSTNKTKSNPNGERKELKMTEWYEYYDTWDAAHAALTDKAERQVTNARMALEIANSFAGNVKGMRHNAGGNATERSEGRVDHNVGRQTEE